MKILHAKSPCCQGKTYRFGNKRRQCAICGKTWTIRPKRRGRKSYRINKSLLRRILLDGKKLSHEFKKDYPSLPALCYRFRKSLEWLARQPRGYHLNFKGFVLLADGLWFSFKKEKWILFLMVLKPINNNEAILLDPVLLRNGESYDNWQAALDTIPDSAKKRIVAFVSDDFRAADKLAEEHQWVHQLCHFHLIAQLQIRRGKRKPAILGRNIREKIYQTIRQTLVVADKKKLNCLKSCLKRLSRHPECPYKLRMIVNEFLRKINLYRAYLLYPELNLPNTTNVVESTCRIIRRAAATLNTPRALRLRSIALIRLRSKITCNGKIFNRINLTIPNILFGLRR